MWRYCTRGATTIQSVGTSFQLVYCFVFERRTFLGLASERRSPWYVFVPTREPRVSYLENACHGKHLAFVRVVIEVLGVTCIIYRIGWLSNGSSRP